MGNRRLYSTVAQYDAKIITVDEAIDRVLLIGEENENNSGGSSRRMKDTQLESLTKFLERLQKERTELIDGVNPVYVTPGW